MKNTLNKIKDRMPKSGTKEYNFLLYLMQIAESAISAFASKAGVNLATTDPLYKELMQWALSIFVLIPCFIWSAHPMTGHLKAVALGLVLEALNRSIMKRLENTDIGRKYLSGDEVILSAEEMEKVIEDRIAEERKLQGEDDEMDEDGNPLEGDSETDEDGNPLEGDTEVEENLIPMAI